MGVKNFKHLLIFLPKCIELNTESKPKLILVSGLDLGVTQDPDPIYSFFGEISAYNVIWSILGYCTNWVKIVVLILQVQTLKNTPVLYMSFCSLVPLLSDYW